MKISSFHVRDASNKEVPVVVSIPHCGIYVPEAIREKFASGYIRGLPLTDWYLHHLCDFLPAMGITTIYGTYSRFVADIDATAVDASFVALKAPNGEDVYADPPMPQEIHTRRALVYAPYHARLSELLQSRITRFGAVVLVDLHSFPAYSSQEQRCLDQQIYLGDNGGRANPGWLTAAAEHAFTRAGLSVARDDPDRSGGHIVRHYGDLPRVSALYIGMRWDLYLDQHHPERAPSHAGFRAFKNTLSDVFTNLVEEINSGAMRMNSPQRLGTRATM
jgi:N-formylglutamate deformylase